MFNFRCYYCKNNIITPSLKYHTPECFERKMEEQPIKQLIEEFVKKEVQIYTLSKSSSTDGRVIGVESLYKDLFPKLNPIDLITYMDSVQANHYSYDDLRYDKEKIIRALCLKLPARRIAVLFPLFTRNTIDFDKLEATLKEKGSLEKGILELDLPKYYECGSLFAEGWCFNSGSYRTLEEKQCEHKGCEGLRNQLLGNSKLTLLNYVFFSWLESYAKKLYSDEKRSTKTTKKKASHVVIFKTPDNMEFEKPYVTFCSTNPNEHESKEVFLMYVGGKKPSPAVSFKPYSLNFGVTDESYSNVNLLADSFDPVSFNVMNLKENLVFIDSFQTPLFNDTPIALFRQSCKIVEDQLTFCALHLEADVWLSSVILRFKSFARLFGLGFAATKCKDRVIVWLSCHFTQGTHENVLVKSDKISFEKPSELNICEKLSIIFAGYPKMKNGLQENMILPKFFNSFEELSADEYYKDVIWEFSHVRSPLTKATFGFKIPRTDFALDPLKLTEFDEQVSFALRIHSFSMNNEEVVVKFDYPESEFLTLGDWAIKEDYDNPMDAVVQESVDEMISEDNSAEPSSSKKRKL